MARRGPEPPPRRAAGELEREVLGVLWESQRPLTPAEVQAAIGEIAYNTVHTILTRLIEKGTVFRGVYRGRAVYAPVKSAVQLAADEMRAVLDAGHDRAGILARFISALDPADEAALRALLAEETP